MTFNTDNRGFARMLKVKETLFADPVFSAAIAACFNELGFNEPDVALQTSDALKHRHDKSIKDSVWGMMHFAPDEMALINSPIVQRLRRVKQLGFSYLTYPTAEHSRFSHTLGVTHVVKNLLRSIDDMAARQSHFHVGNVEIPLFNIAASEHRQLKQSIVHAAILHDIGHVAFSHAGEQAIKFNSNCMLVGGMPVRRFLKVFSRHEFSSDLSECLSIALCLSPQFHAFYKTVVGRNEVTKDVANLCCFIAGVPHEDRYPGLANIISGAVVDADKIDYLSRDARECGIPVGVDTARIFLHSTLIDVSKDTATQLNSNHAGLVHKSGIPPGVHFIVNSAGIDTYDELTKTRTVMYNRVYLHHLTRNAEQMLFQALRIHAGTGTVELFDIFNLGDVELLNFLKAGAAAPIAGRISTRRLMKRALLLSRPLSGLYAPLDAIFNEKIWSEGNRDANIQDKNIEVLTQSPWRVWGRLVPLDQRPSASPIPDLVKSIQERAPAIREALDPAFRASEFTGEVLVGFAERLNPKPAREVLVREKRAIARSVEWTKAEELAQAEAISKAVDYIYSDGDWLRAVRVASLVVLSEFASAQKEGAVDDAIDADGGHEPATFQILPALNLAIEEVSSRIGFDLDELISDLEQAGEYGLLGEEHRLVPLRADLRDECQNMAKRFHLFLGEKGWSVTPRAMDAFIRQFPAKLRREALDLVGQIRLLDRNTSLVSLSKIVDGLERENLENIAICRFSPNSGNWVGMLFEADAKAELEARGHEFCKNISELNTALSRTPGRPILFVDDQFGTGGQAEAQVRFWSGQTRSEWPPEIRDEQNIDLTEILPDLRELMMTSSSLVLGFAFGTKAGKTRIEKAAADVGFANLSVRFSKELESRTSSLSDDMKSFLEDVGVQVLSHVRTRDGKVDLDGCRRDALGYSGTASVVLTQNNVPSHVITALWCPGIFNKKAWIPLFLRRGYRKHLVLS